MTVPVLGFGRGCHVVSRRNPVLALEVILTPGSNPLNKNNNLKAGFR